MNGNSAEALQQPSDQRAGPDRDATVVKESQFKRSLQGLVQQFRLSGDPAPEQVCKHHRITGAGMPERDQQACLASLLCGDRPCQLLRGIAAIQFQTLESEQHRQQPSDHPLHQTARSCRQSTQRWAGCLG